MNKKKKMKEINGEIQEIPPKKKRSGGYGRRKGHSLERDLVLVFRALGFEHCKTSRNASTLLDTCKVDLWGVPLNIQAKFGYHTSRPKFDIVFLEMAAHLESNFPPGDPQRSYPKALFHKLDGYKDENYGVTMMFKEWMEIYKNHLAYLKLQQK